MFLTWQQWNNSDKRVKYIELLRTWYLLVDAFIAALKIRDYKVSWSELTSGAGGQTGLLTCLRLQIKLSEIQQPLLDFCSPVCVASLEISLHFLAFPSPSKHFFWYILFILFCLPLCHLLSSSVFTPKWCCQSRKSGICGCGWMSHVQGFSAGPSWWLTLSIIW